MNRGSEFRYEPDVVTAPGETLLEILDEREMSQAELAHRTGRPKKTINEIIKGKTPITDETAMQLERVLSVPAEFWINRERRYRTHLARMTEQEGLKSYAAWLRRFPYSRMVKFGWIKDRSDESERVRELLTFFGVSTPDQWEVVWLETMAVYRQSKSFSVSSEAVS